MKKNTQTPQARAAGDASRRRRILSENSSFFEREAYKTLRTNIRFALRGEGCKKFCITSGAAGEGKSITLLNLAISFGEAGKKVLLIDADMRRPAVARLLVEQPAPGLANVLAGIVPAEEAIRKDMYPNLDIIFSGDIPPNPMELLSSDEMEKLMNYASERYDYILIDTPPVGITSDACVVANFLDGVLFLVRQGQSRKDVVKQAVENLQLTGVRILGYVLNGVDIDNDKRYKGYESF